MWSRSLNCFFQYNVFAANGREALYEEDGCKRAATYLVADIGFALVYVHFRQISDKVRICHVSSFEFRFKDTLRVFYARMNSHLLHTRC
jgi:hypothetical protein